VFHLISLAAPVFQDSQQLTWWKIYSVPSILNCLSYVSYLSYSSNLSYSSYLPSILNYTWHSFMQGFLEKQKNEFNKKWNYFLLKCTQSPLGYVHDSA
jgi:hypothetical protein